MQTYYKRLIKWFIYLFALFAILAATIVSIGSLLTPYLNARRGDFEIWASELLKTKVAIKEVHFSWYFYKPVIDFENVVLIDQKTQKPTFKIQEIVVNLNLFKSLLQKTPVPDYIKIAGVHVSIREATQGQININGFKQFAITDQITGASDAASDVVQLILAQPYLALENIKIDYAGPLGKTFSVTLYDLTLKNSKRKHFLSGEAVLNQAIPTEVTFVLHWKGDTFDLANLNAQGYIYLEGLSLPQWVEKQTWHHLQVKQGLGSIKLWFDWQDNQWKKIQSEFQFYQLELFSLTTNKTQIISRISGNVGWKEDDHTKEIAGNDILIDLPDHLWPTTGFLLTLKKNPDTPDKKQGSLRLDYVDLGDIKRVFLKNGLLPDDWKKTLLELNPDGEIRALNMDIRDTDQFANNAFAGDFKKISINPFKQFPGISNLTARLNWDGKKGQCVVDSKQLLFKMNSIFVNPIVLDHLSGTVQGEKDEHGNWSLKAKSINLVNHHDLTANLDLSLLLPVTDAPTIDLAAQFSMRDASHITAYLPMQIFSPKLGGWLSDAFKGGTIEAGQAIVRGSLNHFPFSEGYGQFLIQGQVKNLDLHYAADWPALQNIDGHLIFSGNSMTVDVTRGSVFNKPVSEVHAEIPDLGGKSTLFVKGFVKADLSDAERFINESPLNKTLGKHFAEMQLTGPMDLKLLLSVPLAHPDDTKVNGDMTIMQGTMELPTWNVGLSNIRGGILFTEKEVASSALHAILFENPINIILATEHPEKAPSFLKASFDGKLALSALQKNMQFTIPENVQGNTSYTAELNLLSDEDPNPSQLTVRSDLQGLAINLPLYGKRVNEKRNFEMVANFKTGQPLRIKSFYGNALSLAVTIDSSLQGLQMRSGELRIGNRGTASWQTQPGFFITGFIDTLNLDTLRQASFGTNKNSIDVTAFLQNLRAIDISVNKITGFSQSLTQANLQLTKAQKNWELKIKSQEVAGTLTFSDSISAKNPITGNFQYLYLNATNQSKTAIDPRSIPAISIIADDVRYQEQHFGRVAIDVIPIQAGLSIKQLHMKSEVASLTASGDWTGTADRNRTRLQGILQTSNVSAFLNAWGMASSNLIGSGGDVNFNLNWPSAPFNPTLANLAGNLSLKLTRGRIINLGESTDAKMGIGRLLNLLSLQSIPRLLTFDFGGLFAQGYSFDYLRANSTFQNGNALIKELVVDGSVARVEVTGRIGLIAKDYDIQLNVTPYVTGSIPVVAAIAVNPLAGVAAWAVEKVARGAVSHVTTYKYAITGPWANPEWQKR